MKIEFKFYQEKKHSRRFHATDEDAPIKDIYVLRPYADGKQTLLITIKESAEVEEENEQTGE